MKMAREYLNQLMAICQGDEAEGIALSIIEQIRQDAFAAGEAHSLGSGKPAYDLGFKAGKTEGRVEGMMEATVVIDEAIVFTPPGIINHETYFHHIVDTLKLAIETARGAKKE